MIEAVNLKPLRASTTEEICAELQKANARAAECDSIIIVMEKRSGGVIWLANDSTTLKNINWLLDSCKNHLFNELAKS